jgi:hypothetical protein
LKEKQFIISFLFLLASWRLGGSTSAAPADYFAIQVIDEQTNRGVPLVKLETTNNIRLWTDSNGYVAFDEPGLMNQKVYFSISSYGYDYPKDMFGNAGVALDVKPGGSATIKLKRINIAERLYRITGGGIYRDTVLLGKKPPTSQPVLNSQVMGQDSNLAVVHNGKIYWFWGDTNKVSYALGQFGTSGATSELPGRGGLDPSVGVDLHYFVDKNGFSRPMARLPEQGAIWIGGVTVLPDESGAERIICGYSLQKSLGETLQRGIMALNEQTQAFERITQLPLQTPLIPTGQTFRVKEPGGEYLYFAEPYPDFRVKADWKSFIDPKAYEAYTPLVEGTRFDKNSPKLERDATGKLIFRWKKNTKPLNGRDQRDLVKAGKMKESDSPFRLHDSATGRAILAHGGSVAWNAYRKKYVMIFVEVEGKSSMLGDVWYAEADAPLGPWTTATQIAIHEKMSFYNPVHHPFFDADGGRTIYFEGTLTHSFSAGPETAIPRYEYNQLMYRLDLSDPRLHNRK